MEVKYGDDDGGKKKYVINECLHCQITDDKPIMEQLHIYENLCAEVFNKNMKMCEIQQAKVLIEKFPPSWSDYKTN